MQTLRNKFLLLGLSFVLSACNIQTVDYVDVPRYMGLWYQIASNPTEFSGDLVGVTAEYSLREDGVVDVKNSGFLGSFAGPLIQIEGEAVVFDTETNASLIVNFPGQPQSTEPNYLIVILDEIDYQYAVVTNPMGESLFILNRSPQMDEDLYQNILSHLEAVGIDTSLLVLTPQPAQ